MTRDLSREDRSAPERDRTGRSLPEATRRLSIGRDRPIRISAGHRLRDHDGKCARPHGHNYEITIAITGTLTGAGWVVDKSEVVAVIDEWDHRFLLERGDPLIEAFEAVGEREGVVVLDHPPTAEIMGVVLEERLRERLAETVTEVRVAVRETNELCAGSIR